MIQWHNSDILSFENIDIKQLHMSAGNQYRDQTFSMHFHLLGHEGAVENTSLKGQGFNSSQGAQQMLVHKKFMFNHYYCIKTYYYARKLKNYEETALVNFYYLWL